MAAGGVGGVYFLFKMTGKNSPRDQLQSLLQGDHSGDMSFKSLELPLFRRDGHDDVTLLRCFLITCMGLSPGEPINWIFQLHFCQPWTSVCG